MRFRYFLKLEGMRESQLHAIFPAIQAAKIKYTLNVEDLAPATVHPEEFNRTSVGLDDYVILGDISRVRDDTLAHHLINELQKYEKRHGIGEMTKRKLRDTMKKHSAAPDAIIGMSLKNGVIKGAP
jgi:hypothetical protein